MLRSMRTTINLPDGLVAAAKAKALTEGRTLTSLITEGLRTVLQQPEPPRDPRPLPAFGNPDGRALVDVLDREALWAALDGDPLR
jgi:hypothetical protein